MDFLKKASESFGENENRGQNQGQQQQGEQHQQQQSGSSQNEGQSSGGGGFLSGLGNKLNSAAGGGKESEKDEDYLDKG